MANNYLLFSTMVPCKTKEQRDWFVDLLNSSPDENGDVYPPCQFMVQTGDPEVGDGIWVYTGEYGDVDRLAEIVCRWQVEFDIQEPWSLEYAETCSKPRLNEFCGGAVLCYRGDKYFMHMGKWVSEKKKEVVAGLKGDRQ